MQQYDHQRDEMRETQRIEIGFVDGINRVN